MNRWPRTPALTGLLLALLALGANTATAADAPAGEARAARRAQIERRYQAEVEACQTRFAVNACVQEARAARQQALQPLQDEEIAESQSEREQRAVQSRHRLRQKAQDQALLEAQRRSAALMAPPPASVPDPLPAARAASREARAVPDVEKQRSEAEAAAARCAHDQKERLEKAEAHRRQVLQRLQDRALHKPLAPPLPPASAASAAR